MFRAPRKLLTLAKSQKGLVLHLSAHSIRSDKAWECFWRWLAAWAQGLLRNDRKIRKSPEAELCRRSDHDQGDVGLVLEDSCGKARVASSASCSLDDR